MGNILYPHGHDTAAEFAWFGAHLVPIGSEVIFDTPKAVPVWTMTVGDRYVEDYLLKDERGGGFYMSITCRWKKKRLVSSSWAKERTTTNTS